MQKIRMARRWRVLVIVMFWTFLALGSFWLVQVMNRPGLDMQNNASRNLPDYIVDRFSYVRLSPTGQPAYIISGVKLMHRPLDDSMEVDLPYVRSLSATQPPIEMRALRARIDQDNSRVRLSGDVHVERVASATVQSMDLKTQALTVFLDSDRMETDQPAVLLLGQSRTTGIGMKANNATRQIEIEKRLKITYPPVPR
ncbi:MAG: lipopolysaccharide export system protein LptC [Janthinobacterium sp.]|jgi:lipopolysaccharide export system protein LptC